MFDGEKKNPHTLSIDLTVFSALLRWQRAGIDCARAPLARARVIIQGWFPGCVKGRSGEVGGVSRAGAGEFSKGVGAAGLVVFSVATGDGDDGCGVKNGGGVCRWVGCR